MRSMFLMILMLPCILQNCHHETDELLIGVKIYDHKGSMGELFSEWNHLGINTAFSSLELLSLEEYRKEAAEHNITTFVIFPVFFNAEALARSPELYAVTARGEPAKEDWVEFVCPSRKAYRQQVVENAKEIIRKYDPDGISLDFIRHFVFWEMVYPDRDPGSLPITCFDSLCLDHFQSESGLSIPESFTTIPQKASWILDKHEEAWIKWRCGLITSMVQEITEAAREVKPDILINVHLVPWAKDDFQGATKKVAGQDISALSQLVDYLSPMTYAHMVKQEPPWIHTIVEDVYMQTVNQVIPSIQVDKAYLDTELDLAEFEQSVSEALKPPSQGVVFWSWKSLPVRIRQLAEKAGIGK